MCIRDRLGPNMLRKDFPNVWATKDSKLYRILNTLIIRDGFTTLLKSYKKDKKKFVDSLKNLAKSPTAQKRAGFGAKDMQYINKPKKGQSFWSQFDDDVEIDEAFNYTPKEFEAQIKAYKYKNGVKMSQVMKDFDDDWDSAFGNRGYDHDEVENGLKQALKKFRVKFVEDVQEEITGSEDVLFAKIEDLDFSARSLNCLAKANIKYLGDLIQLTEEDLLNLENFGKRSLFEVRDVVSSFSLKLGEEIDKDLYYQQRIKQDETDKVTEAE